MIDVLINGKWEKKKPSELGTHSNCFYNSKGIYETIKVGENKIFFIDEHLQRFFDNASRIDLPCKFKKDEIKNQINLSVKKHQTSNQLIRLILYPQKLLVFSETLNIDNKIYKGVKIMTFLAKRKNPEIKSTDNKLASIAWSAAKESGYFESILIDKQENIYEGSRSNFFWVKNNTIFTKEKNILPGITRQIILKNYSSNICYDTLNVKDLNYINEAFITQTSRGVIPVKQINNISIGRSSPGEKTSELILLYNQWSNRVNK